MLRNTLKDLFPGDVSAALAGLDIAPTARAEELSGAAFVRLTEAVSALG